MLAAALAFSALRKKEKSKKNGQTQ